MRCSTAGKPNADRQTEERWQHIVDRHPEIKEQQKETLETVSNPDYVQKGDFDTKIAVRFYPETPLTEKHLAVVYKQVSPSDGFIVTAYFTSEPARWREVLWKRSSS